MTTQIQLLEKRESDLQRELENLRTDRSNKFSDLSAMPTPSESAAIAIAAMDLNITVLQKKIEDAHAEVDEEKKRLRSPEVKKALQELDLIEGELRTEQQNVCEMLTASMQASESMLEKVRTLYKLRRLAGLDYTNPATFDTRLQNWAMKVGGTLAPLKANAGMELIPASKKP